MWRHLNKILSGHPARLVPDDLIALIDTAWQQNRCRTASGEITQQIVPGCAPGLAHPRQVLHANDRAGQPTRRSEEHTSELQSRRDLVCRLLLEKKKKTQ